MPQEHGPFSLANAFTALAIAILVLVQTFPDYLPASFSFDARLINEMVVYLSDFAEREGESWSYLVAARLFALAAPLSPNTVALLIGAIYVIMAFRGTTDYLACCFLAVLLVPQLLVSLPHAQKDTWSALIIVLVLVSFRRSPTISRAFLGLCFLYILGSLSGRPYYMLIFGLTVIFWLLRHGRFFTKVLIVGSLAVILLLLANGIFGDFYLFPQQNRDFVNLHRLIANAEGNRTAFNNPLPPTDFWNFLWNYFYAFFYLNTPIFFVFDVKSLLMTIYVGFAFLLCSIGWRSPYLPVRALTMLFLSHALVLCLFDPDIGAYLRHFSLVTIYLSETLRLHGFRRRASTSPVMRPPRIFLPTDDAPYPLQARV